MTPDRIRREAAARAKGFPPAYASDGKDLRLLMPSMQALADAVLGDLPEQIARLQAVADAAATILDAYTRVHDLSPEDALESSKRGLVRERDMAALAVVLREAREATS